MFKKLLKVVAYAKAPKRTFAFLHPIKAVKYGAVFFLVKKLVEVTRTA